MNRLHKALLVCLLLLMPSAAKAACNPSYPFNIQNGNLADASQVMANFADVRSCATTVEHSQIGVNGIYASDIIPISAGGGIFGGLFGYQFSPMVTSVTPLTIVAPVGQTAQIEQVQLGATFVSQIVAGGGTVLTSPALNVTPFTINGFTNQTATLVDILDNAVEVFKINGPTGGTIISSIANNATPLNVNGFILGQTADIITGKQYGAGPITFRAEASGAVDACPTINGGNMCSRLSPVYSIAGAAVAATEHDTQPGTIVCVFSGTTSCTTATITLSNADVYTSAASYGCWAIPEGGFPGNPTQPWFNPTSGTTFNFAMVSSTNLSTTVTLMYFCKGS